MNKTIEEQQDKPKPKKWTDNNVVDFVNWYLKLHGIDDTRYTLENMTIVNAFKNHKTIDNFRNSVNPEDH